jgi:hypothetical protein
MQAYKEVFRMPKMITVPESLLEKFSKVADAFMELEDELEDFLLTSDPEFLSRMRQARASHLTGATRPLSEFKKDLCID